MSKNAQQPSIGRAVHYQAHGSPNGQHKSEPRAATITHLHYGPCNPGEAPPLDFDVVGLFVMTPQGTFHNDRTPFDPDGAPGTWRWPPRV